MMARQRVTRWLMTTGGMFMLLAFCIANDTWGLFGVVVLIIGAVKWSRKKNPDSSPS